MKNKLKRLTLGLASASLLTLYGCGGGSSASGAAQVDVPITVIDGLIEKATVCLDKNNNGACDAGEPSGTTGPDGKVTLKVDAADVGKFPVISIVEAGVAIDADTGPVTTSFTMKAPADKTTVITPLTTLVHSHMEINPGTTSTTAADAIKAQTGITVSLFEDFTKGATDAHKTAANMARMVVVTTQEQSKAVIGAVDDEGLALTKVALDKAIQKRLAELLPQMVTLLNDPGVQAAIKAAQTKIDSATGDAKKAAQAEKDAAIQAKALAAVVANGLTKDSVADIVVNSAPVASFGLRTLEFTDPLNYFAKFSVSTAAQATPDASGNVRYTDQRYRNEAGALTTWSAQSGPERQSALHFNGTAWVNCPLNFENTSSGRDANGKSSYNWCGGRATGESTRVTVDIAGKSMLEVFKTARIESNGKLNLAIGDNSDAVLESKLGSATFPAGSKLFKQTSTDLTTAYSQRSGTDDILKVETSTPCANVSTEAIATNLEAMISKFDGKNACVGTKRTVQTNSGPIDSGDRNEGWGATVVSLGNIGTAPANFTDNTATSFYTTNTRLRAAFGANNATTYYSCKERYNGSTRNCDVIGTGTYAIATMGDARVLTFGNLPTLINGVTSKRVYVERGGKVFSGDKDDRLTYPGIGLNMPATKALLAVLNVPLVIDPTAPLALTVGSYQGVWDAYGDDTPTTLGQTFTLNAKGEVACSMYGDTCQLTSLNPATGAFVISVTERDGYKSTINGTLNFLTGTANASYTSKEGPGTAKLYRQ